MSADLAAQSSRPLLPLHAAAAARRRRCGCMASSSMLIWRQNAPALCAGLQWGSSACRCLRASP